MKCYSTDDEDFRYTSIDAIFDAMRSDGQLVSGQAYYEAEFRNAEPKDGLNTDSFLETIDDLLIEEIGEAYSNDVAAVSLEARDELTEMITGWLKKHVDFGRYWIIVGKSTQHAVTAEDVQDDENPTSRLGSDVHSVKSTCADCNGTGDITGLDGEWRGRCNCKEGQATLDTNWGMRSGPMHACPTCGNKRCPHAADLQNPCTNSNEPGQPGSNYPKVPA